MTDTDVTFLLSSNIVGHDHMYLMTLTSPPFLPLSRPWAGLTHVSLPVHESPPNCVSFELDNPKFLEVIIERLHMH